MTRHYTALLREVMSKRIDEREKKRNSRGRERERERRKQGRGMDRGKKDDGRDSPRGKEERKKRKRGREKRRKREREREEPDHLTTLLCLSRHDTQVSGVALRLVHLPRESAS